MEEGKVEKTDETPKQVIADNILKEPNVENLSNIKKETEENKENQNKDKTKVIKLGNPAWKEGVSGNPNGRPKGTFSFIPLLKNALKEMHLETNKTKAKIVVEELINAAIEKKDIRAMKELMDRIDGTPAQTIKGDKDNPVFNLIIKRNGDGDKGNSID